MAEQKTQGPGDNVSNWAICYEDPAQLINTLLGHLETGGKYDKVFIPAGTRDAYIEQWHQKNDTPPPFVGKDGKRWIQLPREMPEIVECDVPLPEEAAVPAVADTPN
jgi:hypothetical protein